MTQLASTTRLAPDAPASAPSLLLVSEVYPPYVGGSGLWMSRIANGWPGRVCVICKEHEDAAALERLGHVDIIRTRFEFPSWAPDTLASFKGYWRLSRVLKSAIKTCRPDVIMCGRGIPEGVLARHHATRFEIPYINVAHGEEITACFTSRKLKWLLHYSYGGAELVIANSRNTRQLAIQAGAKPECCEVVPPGVDVASFAAPTAADRSRWGIPSDAFVVLTVGRLEPRKNQARVVQALTQLVRQRRNVHYVVAGDGIARTDLERTIAECNVRDQVHLLGEVSDQDVRALYQVCDVFAMPSVQHEASIEGFGIVFLEAAAAGKPSIAGNSGGCVEAVVDGVTGIVVDGQDVNAIASALSRLQDDAALRASMGQAGLARARREFDWSVVLQKLYTLVQRSIS